MKLLPLAAILLFTGIDLKAQDDNPFMQMVNKKWSEYSLDLLDEYNKFLYSNDTIILSKMITQLKEVVEKTGSVEWKFQLEYCESMLLYKNIDIKHDNREKVIHRMFELLKKAQKEKLTHFELFLRHNIIFGYMYWTDVQNYELAFEQCEIQAKQLENVSSEDIPEKTNYYSQIAEVHYSFRDYSKALFYLEKALAEKGNNTDQWYRSSLNNTLGLIYRNGFKDFDRSDSCFQIILETKYLRPYDEGNRENWDAIAEGNLGRNMILRGEYDKALPLMNNSLEKILKFNDYAYTAFVSINLAIIHLKKGNTTKAKYYIDMAMANHAKQQREGNLTIIYETVSKYYSATGNAKLAVAYMDSTLARKESEAKVFDALQMMRVEQRRNLSEQKIKEEQLNTERVKNTGYKRGLIITVTGLILIIAILIRYFRLYGKKKDAYNELIRKSQEWAKSDNAVIQANSESSQPDETDSWIFNEIEKWMTEKKIYTDTRLTVDTIAQLLNIKRHNVSTAINRCTKKTFNTYLNEYRVKEAINIISKKEAKDLTIDNIAFSSGFTDRTNFYRVFKKFTGLSPTDFKKNINSG